MLHRRSNCSNFCAAEFTVAVVLNLKDICVLKISFQLGLITIKIFLIVNFLKIND